VAIVCLQVRADHVALIISATLFTVIAAIIKVIDRKLALVVSLFIIVLIVLAFFVRQGVRQNISGGEISSVTERVQLWKKTIQLVDENPWLGVGAGNWQFNFMKFSVSDLSNACLNNVSFHQPHNDFLSVLSETGIVGALLIFLIIIFVMLHALREIWSQRNVGVLVLFCGLAGVLADAFFSFPKERVLHLSLAGVLLILMLGEMQMTYVPGAGYKKTLNAFFLVGLTFTLVLGIYRFKGEQHLKKAMAAQYSGDPMMVLREVNRSCSFFYSVDPTSSPVISFAGWAYEKLNLKDSLLAVSERAFHLSPYDHEVLSNYGFALQKKGRNSEAIPVLVKALTINKCYEPALINMVVSQYALKNYKEALYYLSQIPDYTRRFEPQLIKLRQALSK
jgi:hypothetical protein